MRILMTTRGSSGHLLPLAPIARACIAAGHEVRVAAQRQHAGNLDREGLPHIAVGDPPEEDWMPLMAHFGELDLDTADALMVGEFFGRIDTRAALPELLRFVESWRPDVIVRESWEFASAIASELHDVPLVRVGLGLASLDESAATLAAPAVNDARLAVGLPADPDGERLRDAPYFTFMPESIDSDAPHAASVHRFRRPAPETADGTPDPWPGDDKPLVLLSFGSVAAGAHLPYFPALYRFAIDALAALPARVLVTIGEDRDPEELAPWPSNVRVERWVPLDAVAPRAAVIVCHGGYGFTLGALSYGVPLVTLPLFSRDQWANAEAVERVGAGIALNRERSTRRVLDLPAPGTFDELGPAVRRVIEDEIYRLSAERVADAIRALPDVEETVGVLVESARRASSSRNRKSGSSNRSS